MCSSDLAYPGICGANAEILLGNAAEAGNTFMNTGNLYFESLNPDLNFQVLFDCGVNLTQVEARNCYVAASWNMPIDQSVMLTSLKLGNRSVMSFGYNPNYDNWKFGIFNGLTLTGGIEFLDNTPSIKGDPGVRLLNYAVVNKLYNLRFNTQYTDISNIQPEIGTIKQ